MTAVPRLSDLPGLARSTWRRFEHDRLFRNSAAIMMTTVVTSGLGYIIWLTVARVAGPTVSGDGAAVTSLLMAATLVAAIGPAAAMIEWLPRAEGPVEWRQRVTAGLVATTVASLAGGLVALWLGGWVFGISPSLRTPVGSVLFVVGTVAIAHGNLYDYVCISRAKGGRMLLRNGLASLTRIPVVLLPLSAGGHPIQVLTAWSLSAVLSLAVCVPTFGGRDTGYSLRPDLRRVGAESRLIARSVVGQHLITVTAMLTTYLLPVLVVDVLTPTDNAHFYVTWMLGSIFSIISPAVSTSLFDAAAGDPAGIPAAVRRSVRIIALMLAGPVVVYLLGGRLLLRLFGPEYPAAGGLLLLLLTVAAVPDAVTNVAVSVLRATDRLGTAVALNGAMMLTTLVASTLLLPHLGIAAVGWSWLAAQSAGAVWALVTRPWRVRGAPPTAPTTAAGSEGPTGSAASPGLVPPPSGTGG